MKVCLVSSEILGAHKNGGIGTATSQLSILLGKNGHSVTLFYVGITPLDLTDPWTGFYRAANVRVIHFPTADALVLPYYMRQPCAIYEQLRHRHFDVILFQDWMALGHACMIAKKCGLAFDQTMLATIAHSSTPWLLQANRSFPKSPEALALSYLEQCSAEQSDALVCPSNYLANWMRGQGWNLPAATDVIPYFMHAEELLGLETHVENRATDRCRHIVFFGRLEERKGINLFLQSLASGVLATHRFQLTFLGKPASKRAEEIRKFLSDQRPDLLAELAFHTNYSTGEAHTFLANHDCVAVVPSLVDNSPCVVYELMKLGLPFIAAATGGIPELISEADSLRVLFQPSVSALAAKISEVLNSPCWAPAQAHVEPSGVAQLWLGWFETLEKRKPFSASASSVNTRLPSVTVAITHYERPKLLEQSLNALSLQSDDDFRLIIVDDGSKTSAAITFLEAIKVRYADMNPRVVRTENQYVGAARNTAVRHTDTPYIIFLDDDNVPFPNMVSVFKRAISASGADVVTCQMQTFREASSEPALESLFQSERWAFAGGPAPVGLFHNCFGDVTGIYRTGLFETVGYFHELYGVTYEDWELHLRWTLAGCRILSVPMPLFWYRMVDGSMSRITSEYDNKKVVASVFKKTIPSQLESLIDLLIGSHTF